MDGERKRLVNKWVVVYGGWRWEVRRGGAGFLEIRIYHTIPLQLEGSASPALRDWVLPKMRQGQQQAIMLVEKGEQQDQKPLVHCVVPFSVCWGYAMLLFVLRGWWKRSAKGGLGVGVCVSF